ncbi:hypothetical protein BDY19DRAFT_890074 [Irpex rosettiformis]|uniref:Uncharacterized protein n=1 Tax=Irpex rosettiformis TaxID=378272 RepID=A0ACB8U5D6_9APHY|nr:hypothetical protein BDY19DRAFT_890074 [Irpex rosettiformis]
MEDVIAASIMKLSQSQIATFFAKNAPWTQQRCNQEAERILSVSVQPAFVQGGTSYTVVSSDGADVVQFRSASSALDMNLLKCIEQAYDGFVPHHELIGVFDELYIYKMDNVGGISMYLARKELLQGSPCLLEQTVSDFARFFASAWHKTPPRMQCPDRATLYKEYSSGLVSLQQGLPERFRPTLDALISRFPLLFDDNWPLVPHHTDLLENNIHVSTQTGRLEGICDWRDATIGPFGVSLGGLETMLGIRRWKEGWVYHANQQELRDLFWASFYRAMGNVSEKQKELIEVARLVGLFLDNGFKWLDDETKVPASDNEGHDGLRYLEAVTLKLWASQGEHSWN